MGHAVRANPRVAVGGQGGSNGKVNRIQNAGGIHEMYVACIHTTVQGIMVTACVALHKRLINYVLEETCTH